MGDKARILAFAGSARTDSFNKKLIAIAAEGARNAGADVTLLDLRDYEMPTMTAIWKPGKAYRRTRSSCAKSSPPMTAC